VQLVLGEEGGEEEEEGGEGGQAAGPAQVDLLLLFVVEYALVGLLPKEVGLKVLAVNGFIEWPVVNLSGVDCDLGGVAGAGGVGHHQDQVRVRDQRHRERSLAVTLVAVPEDALEGSAQLLEQLLLQLVQVDLLVTRLRLGLVDVCHLQDADGSAVLHHVLLHKGVVVLVVRFFSLVHRFVDSVLL